MNNKINENEYKWTLSVISSFFAATSVKTLFAPIDKIKIFAQTDINNREFISKSNSSGRNSYLKYIKVNKRYIKYLK